MLYYRIGHVVSEQGLWYNQQGEFTGSIHNEFSFCTNSHLPMDYDPELVGYISVATSMENLFQWFTIEDILELQKHGYGIKVYESDDSKFYDKYQHTIIRQDTAKLLYTFTITLEQKNYE
jgi:hypothetical protein